MTQAKLRIKTGDTVIVLSGKDKKKTGKVTAVDYEKSRVQVEGLATVVKHKKPSKINQKGSIEKHSRFIHISNVNPVHPSKKTAGSRVGFKLGDKKKVRVHTSNKKEIK